MDLRGVGRVFSSIFIIVSFLRLLLFFFWTFLLTTPTVQKCYRLRSRKNQKGALNVRRLPVLLNNQSCFQTNLPTCRCCTTHINQSITIDFYCNHLSIRQASKEIYAILYLRSWDSGRLWSTKCRTIKH